MCFYTIIDGSPVHINGEGKMDDETMAAIKQMVKLAKNYVWMKDKLKQPNMQSREFDKLMELGNLQMPMIARLDNVLKGLTQEEKLAEIKKNETEMSPELHAEIQKFVSEQLRLGKTKRQVRKLVKSKYKIIVV